MSQDHFSLLGIACQFDIDQSLLNANHRRLQQVVHPDKFVAAPPAQRLYAVNQMALINEAWQILKDPVTRAEYLLQLSGWQKPGDEQTIRDPGLLMEQLELRETLADIEQAPDPQLQLDKFSAQLAQLTLSQIQLLKELFEYNATPEKIYTAIIRLKFFTRLKHDVNRLEEKLEDLW